MIAIPGNVRVAHLNLIRFDTMSAAIVANERRAAVEALHKKAAAVVPSSKEEARSISSSIAAAEGNRTLEEIGEKRA